MSTAGTSIRLSNIQVLRAFGALAVANYHTGFTWGVGRPVGSFGVAIFFVISGFIMAMICDTNPQHFIARRVARIVPLYWLLTLAVAAMALVAPNLLGRTSVNLAVLLKSLFFIPYKTNGAYFPVLFLGWSLNYEMYFYVLIAGGLLISKRGAAIIAAVVMTLILVAIRVFQFTGAISFYARPIIFEFVAGVFCYYCFRVIPTRAILRLRWPLFFVVGASSLGIIAAAIYVKGGSTPLVVGAASTVLVLCAVLLDKASLSLRRRSVLLLGDASYVLYLIHPYCQQALNKLLAPSIPILATDTAVGMLFATAITIAVALFVFRYIDNPLHQLFHRLLSKPWPSNVPSAVLPLGNIQV
jgi:peptidoglycan/LPS O-acetylase OafA/YrhL